MAEDWLALLTDIQSSMKAGDYGKELWERIDAAIQKLGAIRQTYKLNHGTELAKARKEVWGTLATEGNQGKVPRNMAQEIGYIGKRVQRADRRQSLTRVLE